MPVRKTNRGHGGLTGYLARFPDLSMLGSPGSPGNPGSPGPRFASAGSTHFESALEKDLFLLLRYQQHVTREVRFFEEQPLRIDYLDAGTPRHYTPDALIHYHGPRPSELVEAKYRTDLRKHLPKWRPGYQAAQAYCRSHGWVFRVRTEFSIRTPLLDHASFIPAFLGRTHDPDDTRLVLSEVQRQGESTVEAVMDALAPLKLPETQIITLDGPALRRATLLPVLWTLVAHGFVLLDVTRPPSLESALRPRVY